MARPLGGSNRNSRFLLTKLKEMYGKDFEPIIKSAENAVRMQEIADDEIRMELGIKDESNIAIIAPKLFINTKIEGATVMVVGVNPEKEAEIKTWWEIKEGKYFQKDNEALIGSVAADILAISPGKTISVNGSNMTVTAMPCSSSRS